MIKNERQYRITRAAAEKFAATLAELKVSSGGQSTDPRVRKLQAEAVESQLADLHEELQEYEALKSGAVGTIRVDTLADLPQGLIKARIASGLSQKELAERLSLKEQQIQRYEAEDYASASFHRLLEVARALELTVKEEITLAPRRLSAVP